MQKIERMKHWQFIIFLTLIPVLLKGISLLWYDIGHRELGLLHASYEIHDSFWDLWGFFIKQLTMIETFSMAIAFITTAFLEGNFAKKTSQSFAIIITIVGSLFVAISFSLSSYAIDITWIYALRIGPASGEIPPSNVFEAIPAFLSFLIVLSMCLFRYRKHILESK